MVRSDVEIFILCLIVFVLSCIGFGFLVSVIYKLELKCLAFGAFDEKIKASRDYKKKKIEKFVDVFGCVFSVVVVLAVAVAFAFSLYTYISRNDKVGGSPAIKVVQSASMERKDENNKYLEENNLDDQIKMFDIVLIHELPGEFDLELYDIVVYQTVDDVLVIHRIVAIEEPNEEHPNERWFTFRGDNVQYSDKKPVLYSQMKGIYEGERVGYWGRVIIFFQSYAGYLCLGLVIFYLIVIPIFEKRIEKSIIARGKMLWSKEDGEKVLLLSEPGEEDELSDEFKGEECESEDKNEDGDKKTYGES